MDTHTLQRLGIRIGHHTDEKNLTGMTVFIAEAGANIGIDIRGSNTATLNTPIYEAKGSGNMIHAVVLTGGSMYGLKSAFGVMQYLEKQNIGDCTRAGVVPGITGAVIYDLAVGNDQVRPGKNEGYAAAEGASYPSRTQGNVGVGMASIVPPHDMLVAAFVVTNTIGDVVNPLTGRSMQRRVSLI